MSEVVLRDRVATVTIRGDFDAASCVDVVDRLATALDGENVERAVVDMSDAGFVDSTGLGALVRIRSLVQRHGGRAELHGLDERLRRLLQLTGVDFG